MKITRHQELDVYKKAFETAMSLFEHTKRFPKDEVYSLTDQIRRSSRSVCANLAEGWRKRRYEAAFVAKLNDAEAEAAETQTWIEFTVGCGYLDKGAGRDLYKQYDEIIGMLITMIINPEKWVMPTGIRKKVR
jgi:four helix bundle protein